MPLGTPGLFNELQWTLLGAAATSVAGVWAYNTWQEYRQRKLAQKVFRTEQADALLPETDRAAAPDEVGPMAAPERIEPVFVEPEGYVDQPGTLETLDTAEAPQRLAPPAELADKLVDCVVPIEADDMVAAPLLWAAQRKLLGALDGRLRWCGWDENHGKWKSLHAHDASSYRHLCAALQFANRSGPLSPADLNGFFDGIQQLAEHFQMRAELPAAAEALAHAQSLDEFCASVDWRIGVNLVNRNGNAISAARLIDLATETDLWLKDDGLFHAQDESGQTQFTLSQLGGLTFSASGLSSLNLAGVTLGIDVPRVADGEQAFDRLLEIAHRMMAAFDASLVDDQRNPLSDEVLATIRAKIGEFQQKMAAHEIPAGSRRAMRLYS